LPRNSWLTPNHAPITSMCRALIFPADTQWLALLAGALNELCYSYNFEQFGTATPDETAAEFQAMFDRFSYDLGECRVTGELIAFAGSTSPNPNWLMCDGRSLLRSDYPDLFAIIGVIYGSVDSAHFNIPDLRDRAVVGLSSTNPIGTAYGEATHTLTDTEMPAHSHLDAGHTHSEGNAVPTAIAIGVGVPAPSAIPGVGITGVGNANLSNTGGSGAHNNIPPSLSINWLIVAL